MTSGNRSLASSATITKSQGKRELDTRPDRVSIDGGHHGLRQRLEGARDPLSGVDVVAPLLRRRLVVVVLLQVGTRAKGAAPHLSG